MSKKAKTAAEIADIVGQVSTRKEVRRMKIIKLIVPFAFVAAALFFAVPRVSAISTDDFFKGIQDNFCGKVVAYYESGVHGIVGESGITHEGKDIVVEVSNGCKNEFIQWFWGKSDEGKIEGEKSVWRLTDDCKCYDGEILVKNAYPSWGTYLKPGANYCVKTTDFNPFHDSWQN